MNKALRKVFSFGLSVAVLSSGCIINYSAHALDSTEQIAWNKRLIDGTTRNYWIDSSCEYTSSIPAAVSGFTNPSGMWNPLTLYRTTVKSYSVIDFYQVRSATDEYKGVLAKTRSFRKTSSGNYYHMDASEKDTYDWNYCEITINDYYLCDSFYNSTIASLPSSVTGGSANNFRRKVIMHELGHVYGCKDLKKSSNKDSLMYENGVVGTGTSMTSDVNNVLNDKY